MKSLFTLKNGCRLPSIDNYTNLLLPMACGTDNPEINKYGMVTTSSNDLNFLVESRKGYCQAIPGGEFSPRLYRGQTKLYPSCSPGMFRLVNYEDFFYWRLKSHELVCFMKHHPALGELMTPNFLVSGYKYDFNPYATAQHYGYQTHLLDLTRSYDIALFFATHHVRDDGNIIEPAIGETAVIYTVDLAALIIEAKQTILSIGIDPLPRPEAQRAFALSFDRNDNFNQLNSVSFDIFVVTEEMCCDVVERLGGIDKIFPYDPFQKAIIELRDNNNISMSAIELVYKAGLVPDGMSLNDIFVILKRGGRSVVDDDISPPSHDVLAASEVEWERRRERFYSKLRYRAVSDHYLGKPA